ncbi:MAG: tetratricopeptide repeat protein [Lachnospiraceae bacterium]|nr:tetratricopeptide repeat protein [Lachnospiraceae bacterium]
MRCMNCGAELTESAYCPNCGCDVSVQKQAIVLSGLYYNQGLEKAQVRDLSGAIDQLRRSLKFNKLNIPARNLLGLVYFEMGEVVAALSEWVISKNIQPEENIAAYYIENLQKDANRLDVINQTIKKYNIALENCQKGNEDVAMIQLKKILAQNPKLIKGYHLLSLLYLRNGEYEKARRLLKKAIKIDKTNTTSLRFLHEIDEQTGLMTTLEPRLSIWSGRDQMPEVPLNSKSNGSRASSFRDTSPGSAMFNTLVGVLLGALAMWFLVMPARINKITQEADRKVSQYASSAVSDSAQIESMNDQIINSQETVNTANAQITSANLKSSSYENLITAYNAFNNGNMEQAANALTAVNVDMLSVEAKQIYDMISGTASTTMFTEYRDTGLELYDDYAYSEAITYLEQAKAINASDYEVLSCLADCYRIIGDRANAIANYQAIVDAYPDTNRAEEAAAIIAEIEEEQRYDEEAAARAEEEAAAQAEAEAAAAAQAEAEAAAQAQAEAEAAAAALSGEGE